MKKLTALLLVLCMAFAATGVFAAEKGDEEAILKVKEKLDIPDYLTEFSYNTSTYDGVLRYEYNWHNEDYSKEINVSADALGRIVSYWFYDQADYSAEKSLIGYSVKDAQILAEETVKSFYPEYFENKTDGLVLNSGKILSSYSGRYKTFTFTFDREYNGVNVNGNAVTVRVRATKDNIYVQSVTAALDEKAVFTQGNEKALGKADYTEKFPIKLYYAKNYEEKDSPVTLYYSVEKGFVSTLSGEIVTEEYFDSYDRGEAIEEDSLAMGTADKNAVITDKEQAELDKIANLIKPEEIVAKLKTEELLNVTDDMKIGEQHKYKTDGGYFVNFTLSSEKRYMHVAYNGETGAVTSIYSYFIRNAEGETGKFKSDNIKGDMEKLADNLSIGKLNETEVTFNQTEEQSVLNAKRLVNGILYPENSVSVVYDSECNMVTSYSLNWDKDVSDFPEAANVIGEKAAEDIIFEIAPVYNTYVKTKDGYLNALTIAKSVTIDAFAGKERYKTKDVKLAYTDIDNHWAKEAINALWEHDIYLPGEKFNPESAITQEDMLRLFTACRDIGVIPIGWEKAFVGEYGVKNGYIEASEPDKLMTRKEGFETLVNILGYGEIAKLDIYKSSYSDLEANGSAEILKALGVLTGDAARPDELMTRAEAAVMVYRYLSK